MRYRVLILRSDINRIQSAVDIIKYIVFDKL